MFRSRRTIARLFAPIAAVCALTPACPGVARAQAGPDGENAPVASGTGPLEATIQVESLRIDKGSDGYEVRRWVPARRLSAGDEVHYTVRISNPGKAAVSDVVVTKRLPFGVHYLRGSAAGPACEILFSSDGGATFATADASGGAAGKKKEARKASTADYTHVRWKLKRPLAPGATALLRFRATFS